MNKRNIEMGVTTYLIKKNMGAKVIPLYMYMKHTNKFLSKIITNLFRIMNPKIKNTTKKIFKKNKICIKYYYVFIFIHCMHV